MKILYFDCFSGAAGDMILGALLDAGLPLDELRQALGSLGAGGWDVSADRVMRCGIAATKFRVHVAAPVQAAAGVAPRHSHRPHDEPHRHPHHDGRQDPHHEHAHEHDGGHGHAHASGSDEPAHRSVAEIKRAIDGAALSARGRARASALVDRLAAAEASVHDMSVDRVHLHEVGAIDSIVDIVGSVFAFEWFGADRIVVSPLNVGSGTVRTAHGRYPVPAPATLELLGDAPVYASERTGELLTPTGALILSDYADAYGGLPPMTVRGIGYGAGDRDPTDAPNVLRVIVGEQAAPSHVATVAVLECEIDDMNPQIFGFLMDRLHAEGALDVLYAPVQMKKNRPGTLVTVLAPPERREALTDLLFHETTTIGVRYAEMQRECLAREIVAVETPFGPVRFKVASRGGRVLNAQPEFDDLARAAAEHGVPLKQVQAIATKAWLERS